MGRPRKPSAILEANGTFKEHPSRRRPNEPKDERELGEPPARLPSEVLPYWREIAEMTPPGVLRCGDRWAVELAARLMEKAVRTPPPLRELAALVTEGGMAFDDLKKLANAERISSAELATLRSLLAALGMTPADRSKLSIEQPKPKNKFAALAEEVRGTATRPN